MKKPFLLTPVIFVGLIPLTMDVVAQSTFVVPAAYATKEGPSRSKYPWGIYTSNGHRVQYCYDSSHFTSINPILIQKIRWRAEGTTTIWTGVTHPNVKIDMSSCRVDQAALYSGFAANHGLDRANVYTGDVKVIHGFGSTTPNKFYVSVTFSSPFLYDPSLGKDLLIDITLPGPWTKGTSSYYMDCASTGCLVSQVSSLSATSATGSFKANVGPVIELTYANNAPSSTTTWLSGCGNPNPLKLDYLGSPIYGTSFKTVVVNAPVNGSGILAIGISKQSWGSLNLPLSLNAIAPGCSLLVSMDALVPVQANLKGESSTVLLLPMNPGLLGQSFHNQAFFLAPAVNVLGVIMSNGGTVTVGNS